MPWKANQILIFQLEIKMTKSKFLIYGLVDPRDGHLRYVGQTKRGLDRPKIHGTAWHLNRDFTHKALWIRKLQSLGLNYSVVIIQELPDVDIINQAEIHWIAYFRKMGFDLTNSTPGGDGFKGRHSAETKAKMSKSATEFNKCRRKSIIDQNGAVYESVSEAARQLNLLQNGISSVLTRKVPSIRGYVFRYVSENPQPEDFAIPNKKVWLSRSPFVDENGVIYKSQKSAADALGISQMGVSMVLRGKRTSTSGHIFKPAIGVERGGGVGYNKKAIVDQYGKIYESYAKAAKELGVNKTTISKMLQGLCKSVKGKIFRHIADSPRPEDFVVPAGGIWRRKRAFSDEMGTVYTSQQEAADALGVCRVSIGGVLRGKRRSAGGHTFHYVED